MEILLQTGQPAPDFELPDLLSGEAVRLRNFRGQVAIVNFWSAACSWAERYDREILPLLAAWGPAVAYLPVAANENETDEELRRGAEARGLPRLLRDVPHQVADCYAAQTTPHYFVIDPGGILRYQGGFNNATFREKVATQAYLVPAVEAVLAGHAPDVDTAPAYGCAIIRYPEE
ncbi:MAG TPA: redoxin domain-containing protein [Anaerolineaceae bacterium]|nr:redoxin domain-containing protein [Anaerolineaceae bacterium]